MASVLTRSEIEALIKPSGAIRNGEPKNIEGIKYDFRQGPWLLKASYSQPIDISKLSEADRAALKVDPGEVVFITTEEILALPSNIFVQLHAKRGLMQSGIVTLGGSVVDPSYVGVLWVGLYNLSSTSFHIRQGRKIIAGVFWKIADDGAMPQGEPLTEFPEELITTIQNYKPIEIRTLQERIDDFKRQLQTIIDEAANDKTWRSEFKAGLAEQNKQIDRLLHGLEFEKSARTDGDRKLDERLSRLDTSFLGVKWSWAIIIFLFGAAISFIFKEFLLK